MNTSTIAKQPDGTITITMTIPPTEVAKAREEVVVDMAKDVQLPGFRRGMAPVKMVEDRLDRAEITENILKKVLPQTYAQAVREHNVRPIINPKLHVEKIEEGQDWIVNAVTCEMPNVDLGAYKENVKKITAKSKIVVPGKEEQKPSVEEIVRTVVDGAKVQIPKVLIEQETDRLLAQLLDDIKKLGLTLEQYLGTTRRSPDDLRQEYEKRAENDIKLEFALQHIAESEKVTVTETEIDEAIQKAKDPQEKQNLEANRYLLAGILRQQKTLDFLMNL